MTDFKTSNLDLSDFIRLADEDSECKWVVGIDFGSSRSGIAYARKSLPTCVRYGAPTATDPLQTKVPTVLLELPGDKWEFGHTAEAKYNEVLAETEAGSAPAAHLYKRFKMVLKGKESGFNTLTAISMSGKSYSLLALVAKSLEFLKDCALSEIRIKDDESVNVNDVQWVLTVPAIWNDFGKAFMRNAAFKAGMMEDEQSDHLMLVLEPEGACLAVHVGAPQHGLLSSGSRFMVLDCGGATIDITVHEVVNGRPLVLRTIAAPSGGYWGGENVNTAFRSFLRELLGAELFNEQCMWIEYFTIYAEFDRLKIVFDPLIDPSPLQLVDVLDRKGQMTDLAAVWNANHPEKPILHTPLQRNGFLAMSKELMLSFFEPSLAAIVKETRRVLREVPGVRHLVVVGGYGASKVLSARIFSEFHNKNGARVILPEGHPKPQGAIVHGAVHFGLLADVAPQPVAAYTYGIAVCDIGVDDTFHVLMRKGQKLPYNHVVSLSGLTTWRIYYSDKLDPTTVVGEHHLGSLDIGLSADPELVQQTATFSFGRSEIRVTIEDASGNYVRGEISMH